LVVLQISNILRDLSSLNLSMQSCKSCMPLSLLHTKDDEAEESHTELFNLCNLFSNCDIRGWGVEGKLLLRICRELFIFVSMTAIVREKKLRRFARVCFKNLSLVFGFLCSSNVTYLYAIISSWFGSQLPHHYLLMFLMHDASNSYLNILLDNRIGCYKKTSLQYNNVSQQ